MYCKMRLFVFGFNDTHVDYTGWVVLKMLIHYIKAKTKSVHK